MSLRSTEGIEMKNFLTLTTILSLTTLLGLPLSVIGSESVSYRLYGLDNSNQSQIFMIEPTNNFVVKPLNQKNNNHNLNSLALSPTGKLYAISSNNPKNTDSKGQIYQIDTKSGLLSEVCQIAHNDEVSAIAFHRDGSLWAWIKGQKLVKVDKINPNEKTCTITTQLPINYNIKDISWNKEGTRIYAAHTTNNVVKTDIWACDYHPTENQLKPSTCMTVCTIDEPVEAIEMLPNGKLMFSLHKSENWSLHALDIDTCQVDISLGINTIQADGSSYNQIESVVFDLK
ncbi:secreted protein [Beggiatoa sp. PS]|nr:secreted protein [Beggiatoa sp. PS]